MRFVPLALITLLTPAVLAQPCDPAQTDEACPDTTDWHRYFPLAVGNQWQYRQHLIEESEEHWSWAITGQTEVAGQAYFELERCDATDVGSAVCDEPFLIRYDDEHAMIVRREGNEEVWWDELPCGMDAEFNEFYECTGPGTEFVMLHPYGSYGATVSVPPDEVSEDTRKYFQVFVGTGPSMHAGLGMTDYYIELQGEPPKLVYANVGGEQVGTPAFASCDPANVDPDIACPDTTDWRRYFPLEVGNEWQYFVDRFVEEDFHHGTQIVGEAEIDGESYFLARRCTKPSFGDLSCGSPFPIRYDEASRTVVRRYEDADGTPGFDPYQVSDYVIPPCPLDAPFGQSEPECENLGASYWVSGTYVGDTEKTFDDGLQGSITLIAGLGPMGSTNIDNDIEEDLVYARISGEEVGSPAFVFPTAGESDAAQPAATAFTDVFPNPARGGVQAQYTLGASQAVTLELIDLLGRRVRSAKLGPQAMGAHDVRIDTGGLRAGVYVLRLRGDAGAEATRRIVVVR